MVFGLRIIASLAIRIFSRWAVKILSNLLRTLLKRSKIDAKSSKKLREDFAVISSSFIVRSLSLVVLRWATYNVIGRYQWGGVESFF